MAWQDVRMGIVLAITALLLGIAWGGVLAVEHENLHAYLAGQVQHAHPSAPHTHAEDMREDDHGAPEHLHAESLDEEAMERLMRGHVHWMGVGLIALAGSLALGVLGASSLLRRAGAWLLGVGAVAYPPAWILMGLRTPRLGPGAAEASVAWLFVPAVGAVAAGIVLVAFAALAAAGGKR